MGNNVKVVTATAEYNFENILGHQIGGAGAIQIMKRDGDTVVIGGFEEITVTLDEEGKAKFADDLYEAEHPPEPPKAVEPIKAANEGAEKKDNVVEITPKDSDGEASDEKEPDDIVA